MSFRVHSRTREWPVLHSHGPTDGFAFNQVLDRRQEPFDYEWIPWSPGENNLFVNTFDSPSDAYGYKLFAPSRVRRRYRATLEIPLTIWNIIRRLRGMPQRRDSKTGGYRFVFSVPEHSTRSHQHRNREPSPARAAPGRPRPDPPPDPIGDLKDEEDYRYGKLKRAKDKLKDELYRKHQSAERILILRAKLRYADEAHKKAENDLARAQARFQEQLERADVPTSPRVHRDTTPGRSSGKAKDNARGRSDPFPNSSAYYRTETHATPQAQEYYFVRQDRNTPNREREFPQQAWGQASHEQARRTYPMPQHQWSNFHAYAQRPFPHRPANHASGESWYDGVPRRTASPEPYNPADHAKSAGTPKRPYYKAEEAKPVPKASPLNRPTEVPKPAPGYLGPVEAKQLFATYNTKWEELTKGAGLHNSDIPFPCRSLQADGLEARCTIHAPAVCIPIQEWSNDTIMRANVQALFLLAVGLEPMYRQYSNNQIGLKFWKEGVPASKINELVEMLKTEKKRWHPDRLGRRNDGKPGINSGLTKDERARAVFHAVCELMEFAQS